MQAGMLMCPNCGAAAKATDLHCGYCKVQLQTIACASCLGMIFAGTKHCSHCGAQVFEAAPGSEAHREHRCPRCQHGLTVTAVGGAFLEECGGCGGVWVDAQSFQQICQDREKQAAYVGAGSPLAPSLGTATAKETVQYVRCPMCGQMMNRMNFARHSGVIVDVCKRHGTWFDRDELRQIVEFIRAGGLDAARERELRQLEVERQRLRDKRDSGAMVAVFPDDAREHYTSIVAAARDLLRWLLD